MDKWTKKLKKRKGRNVNYTGTKRGASHYNSTAFVRAVSKRRRAKRS